MLSKIRRWLGRLISHKKPPSKSSFQANSEGDGEEVVKSENKELNSPFEQEKSREKSNENTIPSTLLQVLPPPYQSPISHPHRCDAILADKSYFPLTDQPHVTSKSQSRWQCRGESSISNMQIRSFSADIPPPLKTHSRQQPAQHKQPPLQKDRISKNNQERMVAAKDIEVGKIDWQTEGQEVLILSACPNSFLCCFLPPTLTNQTGKLITVNKKRYVQIEVKKEHLMVSLEAESGGGSPCTILWQSGRPVPLAELPDLTCVQIDAFVSSKNKRLHAVVVWQNTKPDKCLQLFDNTYMFLDSCGLLCQRKSLDIITKKLSVVFDGAQSLAEICDAVVFIEATKVTMTDILQYDQFYATVFKMMEGMGSGRVMYVCTCLWVGKRPSIDMLPMVIQKDKLYYKVSHGFYSISDKTRTLYCDVDASLKVSGGCANIEFELDGSHRSLVATHLLSVKCSNLEHTTARVSAHVSKELCSKNEKWSAIVIKLPSSTGTEGTPAWLAIEHLDASVNKVTAFPNTSSSSVQKSDDISIQKTDIQEGQTDDASSNQTGSAPSSQAKCDPVLHNATYPVVQNVPVLTGEKAFIPIEKACLPFVQKPSVSVVKINSFGVQNVAAKQKIHVSPTQNASVSVAEKNCKSSTLNSMVFVQENSNVLVRDKTSSLVRGKVNVTAVQNGLQSKPAGQYANVLTNKKTNVASVQRNTAPTKKKQQKSVSLSQLSCSTKVPPKNASNSAPQTEYLTCSVLASGNASAIVTGAGKKILVSKSDLYVNGVLLAVLANVASSLKKFKNLGVIFRHSGRQHYVFGYEIELVALVAWAGKKPIMANTIVEQRLSKMETAVVSRIISASPTNLSEATTVKADGNITEVFERSMTVKVRSRYIPRGRTYSIKLANVYENGTPVTRTRAKKLIGTTCNCQIRIEDDGRQLKRKLALVWYGKKPVIESSLRSCGSHPRQALSTGNLSDVLAVPQTPLAVKSLNQMGETLKVSLHPLKVVLGKVTEVLPTGGRVMADDGRHYDFRIEICFLFGVCLHHIEPRQVLVAGMKVEVEVEGDDIHEVVRKVWVGGRNAAFTFPSLESSLDSWCGVNSVSPATQQALMTEAKLLSPNLFPTASKLETTKIIDLVAA